MWETGFMLRLRVEFYSPLGKVMQPAGIAINHATTIAQTHQRLLIGQPRVILALGTEGKGCNGFYQCGAIQLTGVYHQALLLIAFEGMSHIGNAHKLLGKKQRHTGRCGLLLGLGQQAADSGAILRQCLYAAKTCGIRCEAGGNTYDDIYDTFHALRYFFFNKKL